MQSPSFSTRQLHRVACSLVAAAVSLFATPLAAQIGRASGADVRSVDVWRQTRRRMVDEEIAAAGVRDQRVLQAMLAVPRHEFVTPDQRAYAYLDMCLPIGSGQTISPPFIVASMSERLDLDPHDKVLEIGTGSGYQAAVLSGLVKDVYTIEIVSSLGRRAAATLQRLGYLNVHARIADGYQGWPQHAPYDKIIVTCSPEKIPQPLVDQLKEGGKLAIPIGERYQQTLYIFKKREGKLTPESREPTMFVPMTGLAEQRREVKPDPAHPCLVNGGFEQLAGDAQSQPAGWYYVRQALVASEPELPAGKACLKISNATPGRTAQALQAFGVDGERVTDLELRCWMRLRDVEPGPAAEQMGPINVTFFDSERAPIGQGEIPLERGSADWQKRICRWKVPRSARLAVISIGLFGGVGEISFDALELKGVAKQPDPKQAASLPATPAAADGLSGG